MAAGEQSGQRATDAEVEMARLMLRIASDIDRLDQLADQHPSRRLGSSNRLVETAEDLRVQVEQAG